MNMRRAMETFGNVSCSSSVCINLARSDGDEHPLHLAKVTKCIIPSHRENSRLQICTIAYIRVCRTLCWTSRADRAMAQLTQWLIRHSARAA